MEKYALCILFILLQIDSNSQTNVQKYIERAQTYIGINNILSIDNSLLVCADISLEGNIFLPSGLSIVRLDQKGTIEWSKRYYTDHFNSITTQTILTKEQEIVILAYNNQYSDINNIARTENDYLLLKFTENGTLLWDFRLQIPFLQETNSHIANITEMPNGEYLLSVNNQLFKIDKDGNKLWEKSVLLGEDYALRRILALPNSDIILLGEKTESELFSEQLHNTILTRMDREGQIMWSKAIEGLRPSEVVFFPNNDILLTGHILQKFQQPRLFRLTPEGNIVWSKTLPIQNRFRMKNIFISPTGEIIFYINADKFTSLIKLDSTAEVIWAKSYLKNDNNYSNIFVQGNVLSHFKDGSFGMFNRRLTIDGKDIIIRADSLGRIENCYHANFCIKTEIIPFPAMIEVEVRVEDITEGITLQDIESTVSTIPSLTTSNYCTKISHPSPYFALPDTLCINTPITIDSLCQEDADLWRWKNATNTLSSQSNPQDIQFEEAGLQQLTHIIETDDCLDTFSRQVQIVDMPNFNIGQDTVLCEDTPFVWNIKQGDLRDYTWNDSLNSPSREIVESGVYTAFAHDDYCEVRSSRSIDFIHDLFPEQPIDLGEDTTICEQIPLLLHATQLDASNYLWENGSTLPTRNISETGVYRLSFDLAGCPFEEEIVVETEDCAGKIYIPTAFSPNGDGNNDFFQIETKYVDITRIQIFNRWGALVYEGTAAWDGTINGKEAAEGIYICKMEYLENLLDRMYQVSNELLLTR